MGQTEDELIAQLKHMNAKLRYKVMECNQYMEKVALAAKQSSSPRKFPAVSHAPTLATDPTALHAEIKNLQLKEAMYRQTVESNRRVVEASQRTDHVAALEKLAEQKKAQIEKLSKDVVEFKKNTKAMLREANKPDEVKLAEVRLGQTIEENRGLRKMFGEVSHKVEHVERVAAKQHDVMIKAQTQIPGLEDRLAVAEKKLAAAQKELEHTTTSMPTGPTELLASQVEEQSSKMATWNASKLLAEHTAEHTKELVQEARDELAEKQKELHLKEAELKALHQHNAGMQLQVTMNKTGGPSKTVAAIPSPPAATAAPGSPKPGAKAGAKSASPPPPAAAPGAKGTTTTAAAPAPAPGAKGAPAPAPAGAKGAPTPVPAPAPAASPPAAKKK